MRIIAGKNRGATIFAPPGADVRPTSDKVRGAIFNMLEGVEGLMVLDLFAGSGALALEALSRGAASAVLVDSLTGSIKTINRNLAKLKSENASVVRADFRSFLKNAAEKGEKYDLIFMDPPYRMHPVIGQEIAGMLPEIVSSKGRVVVESGTRQEISLPGQLLKDKVYGDTRVRIFLFP